jgi:geranylgeranyl diphosphate synthase type I
MEASQSKNILEYLENLRPKIDRKIEEYLPRKVSKEWVKEVFGRGDYSLKAIQKAILDPIWDFLDRGGKRWRPALFLLILEAFGKDPKKFFDFATIPEILHNGCVSGDTFVLKNPGEQVKITEIKEGDLVYTISPFGTLSKNKVLALRYSGIKRVYRLKTRNREIEATENHPFLVIEKEQPRRYLLTKLGREKIHSKLKRGDIKKLSELLKRKYGVLCNAISRVYFGQLLEKEEVETIFKFLNLKLEPTDFIAKQTKYESPVIKLRWKRLRDIKPGENLIIFNKLPNEGKPIKLPIPPKEPFKDRAKLPQYTDERFCQLLGYILGDGSISIDKKSSRLCLCPSEDKEEIATYSSLFFQVFGYPLKENRAKFGVYLVCCSYKVCWLLEKLGFHKRATEKTVPDWIFKLPESQKLAFIRGYLDADGFVGKDGTVHFASSSKILIEKLKLLLDSLGFTTSHIYYRKIKNLWENARKKISDQWMISLGNPKLFLEKVGSEKSLYKERLKVKKEGRNFRYEEEFPRLPFEFPTFRIDKVKKIKFVGEKPVYDLMVEGSHNFIANNIVVHNSLIVDDVEDQGELRRGKPCLHRIFGVDIALNAGNFLYFLPIYIFEKNKRKLEKEVYLKAIETYLEEMEKLHVGQGTDIFWHKGKQKKISEKEYFQMCAFKTGCMSRLAAKLAAIFAKKEKDIVEKIGEFTQNIGIAFQIQDDILDVELTGGEREKFGKSFGNDIKEGKRSLMVIYTLKKANKRDRERLMEILDKKEKNKKEILEAISILQKYNSIEYARKKAEEIVRESWKKVDEIFIKRKAKEMLKELVQFLIERKL